MAQAPPRDHRHIGAADGKRRGEEQRDRIPHAAGRMLIQNRPVQLPVQDLPGLQHAMGQMHPALPAEPFGADRHRKRTGLHIADLTRGYAFGEPIDFGFAKL